MTKPSSNPSFVRQASIGLVILFLCLVAALLLRSQGKIIEYASDFGHYKPYVNEKYGYSVEYPADLTPQGEPDAHDGQRFESDKSPLKMAVWAVYSNWQSGEEMTLDQQRSWEMKNLSAKDLKDPKVTKRGRGSNWFSVMGTSGNEVFLRRTAKGKDCFATVELIYPASEKDRYEPIAQRVARSLKP